MKYIKIKKLIKNDGFADYNGLDINKFIIGKQYYPIDVNECVLATSEEDIVFNDELIEITREEYELYISEKEANKPLSREQMLEEKVNMLEMMQMETLQILAAIANGGVE